MTDVQATSESLSCSAVSSLLSFFSLRRSSSRFLTSFVSCFTPAGTATMSVAGCGLKGRPHVLWWLAYWGGAGIHRADPTLASIPGQAQTS